MSKLSDQQLDDLFRGHLMGLEKEPPAGSWPSLAKEVARNNFLKFNWKSFNIFYASTLALLSASALLYYVLPKESSVKAPTPMDQKSSIIVDSSFVNPILSTESEKKFVEKKQSKTSLSKKKNILSSNPSNNLPETKEQIEVKDTIVPPIERTPSEVIKVETEQKKETPKPKKIITVVKRDTVRVKDTVNIKRIRW